MNNKLNCKKNCSVSDFIETYKISLNYVFSVLLQLALTIESHTHNCTFIL